MIKAGAASRVINGELGRPIQGATVDRCAESIRDNLEANALFLRGPDAAVLLISCDLAGIVPQVAADIREAVSGAVGIPARSVSLLQEEFGDDPVDTVPVHAVRVGDLGIVTQPCELFCQFGLDIRRRSPSPHTFVCGIADGFSGYCPTTAGALGGGYSGEPLHWTRLGTDAGYRITDAASRLLRRLW